MPAGNQVSSRLASAVRPFTCVLCPQYTISNIQSMVAHSCAQCRVLHSSVGPQALLQQKLPVQSHRDVATCRCAPSMAVEVANGAVMSKDVSMLPKTTRRTHQYEGRRMAVSGRATAPPNAAMGNGARRCRWRACTGYAVYSSRCH